MSTPVLFIIFNRPDTTAKVFAEIRKQKPKNLYIAADGPRKNFLTDVKSCEETRLVVSQVDWDCEVKTLFQTENLGCGVAPAKAISWFFDNVEMGIILEDDILVDQTFFTFCEAMLYKYEKDEKVMHISGCQFLENYNVGSITDSYLFSKHIHVWGWATWKRAWKHYDYDMQDWSSKEFDAKAKNYYGSYSIFWKDIFAKIEHKGNDIWDYQWMYAIYKNNGIAINSGKNLTKNIGFGANATHTTNASSIFTQMELSSINEIVHPSKHLINVTYDEFYYKHFLDFDLETELAKRNLVWKLKKHLRRFKLKFLGLLK